MGSTFLLVTLPLPILQEKRWSHAEAEIPRTIDCHAVQPSSLTQHQPEEDPVTLLLPGCGLNLSCPLQLWELQLFKENTEFWGNLAARSTSQHVVSAHLLSCTCVM